MVKLNEGEWKGGIWYPMINNPKGYNRHKKNPAPKKETSTEVQGFLSGTSDYEQKQILAKLGNENYKLSCELLKKKRLFTKLQREYFGWRWKDG